MEFLTDFLHQEVPKSGREMPAYYRKALFISEVLLVVYFLVSIAVLWTTASAVSRLPFAILAGAVACLLSIGKMSPRLNLACFAALVGLWLTWYVHWFGWSAGSPNILVTVLALAYFNIYEPPTGKILYFLGIVGFRIGLFAFSLNHPSLGALSRAANIIFQVVNSIVPLLILVLGFILFSSSIQASERQLTIHNQELHIEAGTDPLTGLPNRRAMMDIIEGYRRENPMETFGIAIADIDFFKRVNDTYGHNCGDYTLKALAGLFQASAENQYSVCRWGGEEFFFFMPGRNLDEAGAIMHALHTAVDKLPLRFGNVDFSITITVGVEENDFQSSTEILLDKADRKLYIGKAGGRNRVVI